MKNTTENHNLSKSLQAAGLLALLLTLPSCGSSNEPEMNRIATEMTAPESSPSTSSSPSSPFDSSGTTEPAERTVKDNVTLDGKNVGGLAESAVLNQINAYAQKTDREAVNATLNSKNWEVKKGKVGKKVDVQKTLEAVLSAREGVKLKTAVKETVPSVTSQKLLKTIVVIGKYTTPILDKGDSRVNNIDIAGEKIDGIKLSPGEEFSFNKVVGRRTEGKGYEDAPIIIKTPKGPKKDIAVGGGICQVSTTLYNAVEECGLKIVERHLHSKRVGYVPKGEDATVNYGSADLKFRNTRSHPVMIRVYLGKKTLTVEIVENRSL